jgi:peptidoglycan hydrolase-like protein with peptidoglycan-binding domain
VRALQQEMTDAGYWLGKIDGKFGDTTRQAVWAIQKASGHKPTGVTDKATWAAIHAGTKPKPRSTSGRVIEVDLKRNLVLFVNDGRVSWVLHASTGGGYTYTSEGVTSKAITPKGHFHTYRVVDGPDKAPLGLLWRPRYFSGGVAIHGDSEVPVYPASHGCVRVSNSAMDWVWAQNLDPIGTSVWVY